MNEQGYVPSDSEGDPSSAAEQSHSNLPDRTKGEPHTNSIAQQHGHHSGEDLTEEMKGAIDDARQTTKDRIILIWTGGTIASVLKSESCGPVFMRTLNSVLNAKDQAASPEEFKKLLLAKLEAVPVEEHQVEQKVKICRLIQEKAKGTSVADVIKALKSELQVSIPGLTGNDFVETLPSGLRDSYDFDVRNPFLTSDNEFMYGIDSTEMLPEDMEKIGLEVDNILSTPEEANSGVIITHGTDTMTNTAAYLAFRNAAGLDRPIVLTGSQIRPGDPLTDAHNNFALALKAAKIENCGEVLIAFGEKISRGVAASKLDSISKDGFGSPHQHTLATLTGTHLDEGDAHYIPRKDTTYHKIKSFPGVKGRSMIIEMDPKLAANPDYLEEAVLNPDLHDAVILQGYAAGNIPTSIAHIMEKASRNMLIIITPKGATHGERETSYEGTADVSHPGAVFAKGMVSSVADTKFQWLYKCAMELGLNKENKQELLRWIRSRFSFNYVHESPPDFKENSTKLNSKTRMQELGMDRKVARNFRHVLLRTDKAMDPATITHEGYERILDTLKREWLEKMASRFDFNEIERGDWIEEREHLDIPLETILDLWNAEEHDPLWDRISSPRIKVDVGTGNLNDVLRRLQPESATASINDKLGKAVFIVFSNYIENVFDFYVEKMKRFDPFAYDLLIKRYETLRLNRNREQDKVIDMIDIIKGEIIYRGLVVKHLKDYLTNEAIQFSNTKIRDFICSKLAGPNRRLLEKLQAELEQSETDELSNHFNILAKELIHSMVEEILNQLLREDAKYKGVNLTLNEYVLQNAGMTLADLKKNIGDHLPEIFDHITPQGLDGTSLIDAQAFRHSILNALNVIFLHHTVAIQGSSENESDRIESDIRGLQDTVRRLRSGEDHKGEE